MRAAACVFGLLALVALPAHADIIGKATVIDGTTLEIAGQRIQLHRIAAPEPDQTWR
jgi:endonuclease YncB( thermonuclease family)